MQVNNSPYYLSDTWYFGVQKSVQWSLDRLENMFPRRGAATVTLLLLTHSTQCKHSTQCTHSTHCKHNTQCSHSTQCKHSAQCSHSTQNVLCDVHFRQAVYCDMDMALNMPTSRTEWWLQVEIVFWSDFDILYQNCFGLYIYLSPFEHKNLVWKVWRKLDGLACLVADRPFPM